MVLSCRCPVALLFLLFGSKFCMVAAQTPPPVAPPTPVAPSTPTPTHSPPPVAPSTPAAPPSPPPTDDINECLSDPCQNGATCVNTAGSYTCTCAPGYTFGNCDVDINECNVADPCLNGATCVNTFGSYMCICAAGFSGENCEGQVPAPATPPVPPPQSPLPDPAPPPVTPPVPPPQSPQPPPTTLPPTTLPASTDVPTFLPTAGPTPVPSAPPTKPPVRRKTFNPANPPIPNSVDPPTPRTVDPPTQPPTPNPVEPNAAECLLRIFGVCTCFSEHTEVQVLGAGTIPMKDLKVGDKVLTDEGFSTVYSFGHKLTEGKTSYLQVLTDSTTMKHPLEISQEHLIFKHAEDSKATKVVPAGDLKVGDHLVTENGLPAKIVSISTVVREGAYSPLATKGKLLVNGVLASSYVTRSWVKDSFSGGTLHAFQHGSVVPYRFFCWLFGCKNELYDEETGFSPWVHFWYGVEQWQLQLSKNGRLAFFSFLVIPSILATLLGKLLGFPTYLVMVHMAAGVFGYVVWNKAKKGNVHKNNEMKPTGKVS